MCVIKNGDCGVLSCRSRLFDNLDMFWDDRPGKSGVANAYPPDTRRIPDAKLLNLEL